MEQGGRSKRTKPPALDGDDDAANASITCVWNPQPPTPGSAPPTPGQIGVRDPVVWTQEELRVLSEGYVFFDLSPGSVESISPLPPFDRDF